MRYANDDNDNMRMITILERLLFKKRKTLVVIKSPIFGNNYRGKKYDHSN